MDLNFEVGIASFISFARDDREWEKFWLRLTFSGCAAPYNASCFAVSQIGKECMVDLNSEVGFSLRSRSLWRGFDRLSLRVLAFQC